MKHVWFNSIAQTCRTDKVGLKSGIDNLFNRFFDIDSALSRKSLKAGERARRLDVSEGEKEITIIAEIPGCDAKNINCDKKQWREKKAKNHLRAERVHGYFSRSLELRTDVDEKQVEALYIKGVLKVVLRKTAAKKSQKIEIKTR